MAVAIRFDANQQFQHDAIYSVTALLDGLETIDQAAMPLVSSEPQGTIEGFHEVVFGNALSLAPETIEANLRRVQDRPVQRGNGSGQPAIPESERRKFANDDDLDFSVEMETGTGKTYVYLRTIAELHQKYGLAKFVIVVPSVAIREGVLSNLRLLQAHIRKEHDGLQYDADVYDSRHLTRVRQFATASHLQILVINIDSFTKDSNVINRPSDAMNGYAPIEFLRACRPVVVMDEPQNMETPTRREAIRSLHPLLKLRYSATHRDLRHLVYRLTPVDAYDLRLVKRIGVLAVTKDVDLDDAYVEVTKITATSGSVTATARIHKATTQGTKPTQVTLRKDDDLFELSGHRSVYEGWYVEDIHAPQDDRPGYVDFGNGRFAQVSRSGSNADDQHQRLMIRQAVESHFEKEFQLRRLERRGVLPARLKPLTLFFIDRVANYAPMEGKFRLWFEEEYEAVRAYGRYRAMARDMPSVADVHDGYFATTAKGVAKDTQVGRDTKEANAAFERIMRAKEKLVGFEEPLRFIFSHSALVEGWDNPNVFTICNLQEGRTEMRKRQQIGRGLRLPVMENGERCHDDDVNLLTVIAHEDFATFAGDLQKEIEDETGASFDGRIVNLKRDKIRLELLENVLEGPRFVELWDQISPKTTYRLDFATAAVVDDAVRRINGMEALEAVKFRVSKTTIGLDAAGVTGTDTRDRGAVEVEGARRLPDVVGELTRRVPLSRATVVRILGKIDDLEQVRVNPAVFIDQVAGAMNEALYTVAADGGIEYSLTGERWSIEQFKDAQQTETVVKPEFVVPATKSVTDKIVCDSKVEVEFARELERRDDILLFLKLPGWFKISTPLGNYNPDWAFIRQVLNAEPWFMVGETKGTDKIDNLQWESEGWKIKFGRAHFEALGVDYDFGYDLIGMILRADEGGSRDA